jgi:cytosine/adenosine deaminase-related metal-dependent hydrolase
MTDTIIMRGAYAITDPRLGASGVIPAGAVVIRDGTVKETGPCAAIAPKYPGATIIGDGTQLLLPGLVDAHSHGRGLSPIQKGVRNDFLENALFDWAYMPILPPELTAAICALRHLRSGCTLLHHNGFDDDGAEGARPAHIAIKTYLSTGIRLAFSPGVRDESKLAMGGEEFIETLPSERPDHGDQCAERPLMRSERLPRCPLQAPTSPVHTSRSLRGSVAPTINVGADIKSP